MLNLLLIDAIHIGDDKRLLVFLTQVCVIFSQTQFHVWSLLGCARLVHKMGDRVPLSQHFKISQLNTHGLTRDPAGT